MIYMLELHNIQKSFGSRKILSIPSLQLDPGIFWIQGPNGSGKTTFLKIIAGLQPFKGDILLSGCSIRKTPVKYRQSVSWAEAEPLYPDFLNGIDLVSFYQPIKGASDKHIAELVALFNMRSYLSSRIGTWSSGMIKKLSLLLAFMGKPALLLLDEPLVTLDHDAVPVLYELIRTYRLNGTSFILSSHQLLEPGFRMDKKMQIVNQQILWMP